MGMRMYHSVCGQRRSTMDSLIRGLTRNVSKTCCEVHTKYSQLSGSDHLCGKSWGGGNQIHTLVSALRHHRLRHKPSQHPPAAATRETERRQKKEVPLNSHNEPTKPSVRQPRWKMEALHLRAAFSGRTKARSRRKWWLTSDGFVRGLVKRSVQGPPPELASS